MVLSAAAGCATLVDVDGWSQDGLADGGTGVGGSASDGGTATVGPVGGEAATGGDGAGGAGGAPCAAMGPEACETPEDENCDGFVNEGCGVLVYGTMPPADPSYPDEAHVIRPYGAGQLNDGTLGDHDYAADLGSGPSYEWVGWSSSVFLELTFLAAREVTSVRIGLNRNSVGSVQPPAQIVVSVFDPASEQYLELATETTIGIQDAKRSDFVVYFPKVKAEWLGVELTAAPSSWLLIDEVSVGP
jgi:hypothetical protein